jgi:Domain of unknown function (DUF4407)
MIPVLRKFLLVLSGAQPEVLEQCPSERIRFESLGWAILITSGIATVSMWFALNSAMGLNPFIALLGAIVWGLVIMGIDRWLVTSMPTDSPRRLFMALPRLALAVLLGTLISTPFVLRIFQSEIDAQIAVIKADRASAFLAQQQHSQVGKQVTYWRGYVANLQKTIDSGGAVALNPATDPDVRALTSQRSDEITLKQKYYRQWQCQLYGGPGCPKGNGPLAQASKASYEQASNQVSVLTQKIQQRENQLSATDAASKQTRLHQATSALPGAQQQLALAVARQNALQANFDAQNEATNGLLIRLQALSQLSNNDFTVSAARILLFLLFLVIECLPVTVKLMQRPGNYETILAAAADYEVRNARKAYKYRLRASAQPAALPERARAGDTNLFDIWQRTDPIPNATFAAPVRADPLPRDLDLVDSADQARLDDTALRDMEDINTVSEADRRGGGIPLRYDDDDL